MERYGRLEIANEFIKIISSHGRRFFYCERGDSVAYLKLKKGRVYYVSEYSGKEIYLHYKHWRFSHGGTLRQLIDHLKEYIMGRDDLPLSSLGPWHPTL